MSSKTVEELIALAQSSEEITKELSEVDQFIADMEIEASETEKVYNLVIYWFYIKWKIKGYGGEVLTRQNFFNEFSKRFKSGRDKNRYYRIKRELFIVSKEEMREIKEDIKQERIEWQKEKRRKKLQKEKKRIKSLRKKGMLEDIPD